MSTKQQKKREAREAKDALERARAAKRKAAMYVLDSQGASPVARDVMEGFKPFGVFDRNGLRCSIDFACPGHPSWSAEAARATFELTRSNMRALYEAAPEWGWKEGAKRAEMLDPENRYLVAREAASDAGGGSGGAAAAPSAEGGGGAAAAAPSAEGAGAAVAGEILGFVSFRFVLEGDFDVLYVYELQMGPKAQRKGLGKHLMQICELVARKSGMQCVQLTVLKNNVQALDFYTRKMKYVVDSEISASAEDAAHEILTKVVNPAECQAIKDRG